MLPRRTVSLNTSSAVSSSRVSSASAGSWDETETVETVDILRTWAGHHST